MKLKLDEQGHVVVQDGKPVYVHDDGKEIAFDAPATVAKISQLNGEARGHRERAEAAEKKLKEYDGLDPAEARNALEQIKNIDRKKLVDAGEVEKVKSEIAKGYETKLAELENKFKEAESQLYQEKIGGSFARSKFITDKMAIPADFVQARFGDQFKIEEGKIVAYDKSGSKIYSRAKPGELADFDEALEILVDAYPQKDSILKGSGASGAGTSANARGGGGTVRTIMRADFDKMAPTEKAATAKEIAEGKAKVIDG